MNEQEATLFKKRYLLHETIGSGGMGMVCVATDRLTGKQVALKRLRVNSVVISGNQQIDLVADMNPLSLAHEFEVLASLRHPYIVEVLDYGFDNQGHPFFTMELLENAQSILEACKGQPLLVKIGLLVQVLQALAYLHRHNLLHRDIKPSNILVANGQAKIIDFGLTIIQQQYGDAILAGTIPYMSPELLHGEPHSSASDLYALGMVAYELLMGRHPFDTANLDQLVRQIMKVIPDLDPDRLDEPPTVVQNGVKIDTHLPFSTEAFTPTQIGSQLVPVLARLLEKDSSQRYSNPQDVIIDLSRAVDQPIPLETKETRDSVLQAAAFVGREKELAQLTKALHDLENGASGTWLIGGESGVGKTRLLNELRTIALVKGVEVVQGQAIGMGSRPYQLWIDILWWLILMNDISPEEAQLLHTIMPDLPPPLDPDDPDRETIPITAHNIMQTVVNLLERQISPLLLLLEDLHWARDESLSLLIDILPEIVEFPILIIGSYRDDEVSNVPYLLDTMSHLKLERLNHADVARLSSSMLGQAGQEEQLVDWLHERSEGNVFFLIEVLRALSEEGVHLENLLGMTIPPQLVVVGIEEIVQRRLQRVPGRYQRLLKIVAVIGRQVEAEVAQEIDAEADWDEFYHICAEASVLEMANERWRFAHDKLREGILDNLSQAEQQNLHQQVAQALETIHGDAPEQSARLAYYWQMAGDSAKELHYTALAGEHALQVCAYQEAVFLFERGLNLAQQFGQIPQQIHFSNKSGEAHWRIGAYTITRERLAESLTLASATYDRKGMTTVLRILGNISQEAGKYIEAVGHLTRSLAIAREIGQTKDIADALRSLAVVMVILGKHERAMEYHHEGLALYREIDDYNGIMKSLHGLGLIARLHGNFDEAQEYHEQSLALGQQVNDRRGIGLALNNLGSIALAQQHYDEAQQYQHQSLEIFESIGDRHGVSLVLGDLGYVAWERGNMQIALTHFYEAVVEAFSINAWPVGLNVLVRLATLLAEIEPEKAMLFLGFILEHTTIDSKDQYEVEKLFNEVKTKLPASLSTQLFQQGKSRSLEELFQSISA